MFSAGESLDGIDRNLKEFQDQNQQTQILFAKRNLELCIHFLKSKFILQNQITAEEIVGGNFICMMQIILALASYYKPQSVMNTHTVQNLSKSPKKPQEENNNSQTYHTGIY